MVYLRSSCVAARRDERAGQGSGLGSDAVLDWEQPISLLRKALYTSHNASCSHKAVCCALGTKYNPRNVFCLCKQDGIEAYTSHNEGFDSLSAKGGALFWVKHAATRATRPRGLPLNHQHQGSVPGQHTPFSSCWVSSPIILFVSYICFHFYAIAHPLFLKTTTANIQLGSPFVYLFAVGIPQAHDIPAYNEDNHGLQELALWETAPRNTARRR